MTAGRKKDLITIERGAPTTDNYGGETLAWASLGQEWAEVVYGNGVEQRQAAMEGGSLPATFLVHDNAMTRALTLKDRITFNEGQWDITDNKPANNRPGDRALTAVRSL